MANFLVLVLGFLFGTSLPSAAAYQIQNQAVDSPYAANSNSRPRERFELVNDKFLHSEANESLMVAVEQARARSCSSTTSRFEIQDRSLVYSNLGGRGPHTGYPKAMYLDDIFRGTSKGGSVVDAIIKVHHDSVYYPQDPKQNIVDGGFAIINMASGSTTTFEVSFVNSSTGVPVVVEDFDLTFFGLGRESATEGIEMVTVTGVKSYTISNNSVVQAEPATGGFSFTSTADAGTMVLPHGLKQLPVNVTNSTNQSLPAGVLAGPLSVPDDILAASVSMLVGGVSSLTVTLSVASGWEGHNFVFAGSSNMVCDTQYLCSSMMCPAFYKPKDRARFEPCSGAPCVTEDVATCCESAYPDDCEPENTMMFSANSVLWSNLDGHGPDFDMPHSIFFANVFPNSHSRIELNITTLSEYTSDHPERNGQNGVYAEVNLNTGSSVDLRFSFVNMHGHPQALPHEWFFTVFDFDEQHDGQGQESIIVDGFLSYYLSDNSTVKVHTDSSNRTVFTSTEYGNFTDNPTDPRNLTDGMLAKMVTLTFPPTERFDLTLATTAGMVGRNFMFTGSSDIPCPSEVTCRAAECPADYVRKRNAGQILCMETPCNMSDVDLDRCCKPLRSSCDSFTCPSGYTKREGHHHQLCAGEVCNEVDDVLTCCARPWHACTKQRALELSGRTLMYNNLGGRGPNHHEPHAVYFLGVFEGMPDVALRITNLTEYKGHSHKSHNGVLGAYAALSFASDEQVQLKFELVNHTDAGRLKNWSASESFYFTIANIDPSGTSVIKEVHFNGKFSSMEMSANSNWAANGTHFHSNRSMVPSPVDMQHPLAMSQGQQDASLTFYIAKTHWKVTISSDDAESGSALYFGGASTLTCESHQTCHSLSCPAPKMMREDGGGILCQEQECFETDISQCCGCSESNSLLLSSSSLLYSNLNGHGPDFDAPQSMYFADVFPHDDEDEPVDMEITSPRYEGNNVENNGLTGSFGQINVKTGSMTQLHIRFLQHGINKTVGPFYFSIFDIDQQADGAAKEMVSVSPFTAYTLAPRSEVAQIGNFFASTSFGDPDDNPSNCLALTEDHLNRTVTFTMPALSSFDVTFNVSDGWYGRNFLFTGPSNLVCESRPLCSSFTCADGWLLKKDAAHTVCRGKVCSDRDHIRCCYNHEAVHSRFEAMRHHA